MTTHTTHTSFETFELEPVKLAVRRLLPPTVRGDVRLMEDVLTRARTTVRVPASWWQHFKLSAIEAGNPFFDPARVRYREVPVTLTREELTWWPEAEFPVPEGWGAPVRLVLAESAVARRSWPVGATADAAAAR